MNLRYKILPSKNVFYTIIVPFDNNVNNSIDSNKSININNNINSNKSINNSIDNINN